MKKKSRFAKLVGKAAKVAKSAGAKTLTAVKTVGALATSDTAAFMLNDSRSYDEAAGKFRSKVHAEKAVEHLEAEYRAALGELKLRLATAQTSEELLRINVQLTRMGLGAGMTGPDFSSFNFQNGLAGSEATKKRLLNDEDLRKMAKEIDIQIKARLKAMKARHDIEKRLRQDNARTESGGSAGPDSKHRKHAKSSQRKYGFQPPS